MKILITDQIADTGIEILRQYTGVDVQHGLSQERLHSMIKDYEALVVRSQTRVTSDIIDVADKLIVIARVGTGVDNIDVEAATNRGIYVINSPEGNIVSTAEHTIAMLLAAARNIPRADSLLHTGVWDRGLKGIEVRNKTLGIIGLGSVGSEVARRARGLEMKLIACDPFISVDHARNLQVELVSFEQLLKESDFITLHLPLTESTKGLIGAKELSLVKPQVHIINTARGGLIDDEALVKAIKKKRVAGAAVDVFPEEPVTSSVLFESDNIIVTPHLGASTAEAQVMVARDVATQIVDVLRGQPARYAVNAPFVSPETLAVLAPFIRAVAATGKLASQLAEGQMNAIEIRYEGELTGYDTNVLKAAILGGILNEVRCRCAQG